MAQILNIVLCWLFKGPYPEHCFFFTLWRSICWTFLLLTFLEVISWTFLFIDLCLGPYPDHCFCWLVWGGISCPLRFFELLGSHILNCVFVWLCWTPISCTHCEHIMLLWYHDTMILGHSNTIPWWWYDIVVWHYCNITILHIIFEY